MQGGVRRCGARRWKTRGRLPRRAGSGSRARRVSRVSRAAWASRDCNELRSRAGANRLDQWPGAEDALAGGAALDADFGNGTFLPVSDSAGGIDRRMSSSFLGGGCGSSPLQPASSISGETAQCNLMPPGKWTVFWSVVFSIVLLTARPTVFAPRLSLSGAQSWLKRVGVYGTGDLPL